MRNNLGDISQLRSFSFFSVICIPVLRAPMVRLRGPIIVRAALQLICRYAAVWADVLMGFLEKYRVAARGLQSSGYFAATQLFCLYCNSHTRAARTYGALARAYYCQGCSAAYVPLCGCLG